MQKQDGTLLVLGGGNLLQPFNHRVHHVVSYLRRTGIAFDLVGQKNFYVGPRAGWRTRLQRGFKDLASNRADVNFDEEGILVTVRSLPGAISVLEGIWAFSILKSLIRRHYDLCIFGHPMNSLLASLLKRSGVVGSLIYEDWDFYPGFATSPLSSALARWRERRAISIADVVVSVSDALADLRRRQGAKEVVVMPNGVDYPLFEVAQDKPPHPPTLVFMGTFAHHWGVDIAIRAMPSVRARLPQTRLHLLGAGPDEEALRALAYGELRLEQSVRFLGRHEYKALPGFLTEADVGVCTYRSTSFTKYVCSIKASEYMSAGLPVVGTRVEHYARIIEEGKAGLLIEPNPDAFAEAALSLLGDAKTYQEYSHNAVECGKAHDWNRVLAPMSELISRYVRC